ncbi:hypothetical protein NMG60_11032764 [Bertholletia excelsa]
MAAAEQVLKLFDSHWFEHRIFTGKPPDTPKLPHHHVRVDDHDKELTKMARTPTIRVRSLSDHCLSSRDATGSSTPDSLSPISVLLGPKLQPILSGEEFSDSDADTETRREEMSTRPAATLIKKRGKERRKGNSRSMSELEFEELKGFMDLGFVFSEEDKISSLVSIIPGLQRLGEIGNEKEEKGTMAARPYLSERWEVLGESKLNNSAMTKMKWRIPAVGSEMDMKHHLRIWAHTVASTVR